MSVCCGVEGGGDCVVVWMEGMTVLWCGWRR